jgi:hypothetical protein
MHTAVIGLVFLAIDFHALVAPWRMVLRNWIGFIQKHQFHWTAFTIHPKAGPPMPEDWSYTPNAVWGAFVKRALVGERFELKNLR